MSKSFLKILTDLISKLKVKKGTGFESYIPINEDYHLGAVAGKQEKFKDGHGIGIYLPIGELQNRGREKFTCTNHATNNALEVLFKWLIKNEPQNPIVKFLELEGGIIDSEVNLSDRFDAWASGTRGGNNYKRVCDSKRHNGFLFEHEWQYVDDNNEYFKTPPTEFIQKARRRAETLDITYEFVSPNNLIEAYKYGSVATCGHAWLKPANGIYQRTSNSINHAFLGFDYEQNKTKEIFDTYLDTGEGDFTKTLAWDYNLGWGVQLSVNLKKNFNLVLIEKLRKDGIDLIMRTNADGEVYELTDYGLTFLDSNKDEINRHIPLVDYCIKKGFSGKAFKILPINEETYKKLSGEN